MTAADELFPKVEVPRASIVVADRLRALIRGGQLKVGERLPAERDLCESLGVSRVTVREALRMLEANGLIRTKSGVGGGAIVTAPEALMIGEGLADMLRLSALSPRDVTEARRLLELGIVPLVCDRATAQDIADLRQLCEQTRVLRQAGRYDVANSFDFHLRVADATHNPAIALLLRSFRAPILHALSEANHGGTSGVDEHLAFVDAVAAGDVERATTVMAAHLERTVVRVGRR